jgi:transcription initiation factor TFIID subunit 11
MRGTTIGAKRGRKPRGTIITGVSSESTRPFSANSPTGGSAPTPILTPAVSTHQTTQYSRVQWAIPGGSSTEGATIGSVTAGSSTEGKTTAEGGDAAISNLTTSLSTPVIDPALASLGISSSVPGTPKYDGAVGLTLPTRGPPQPASGPARLGFGGVEEDVEADDEVLPAMADDDYSAQLSWQSQSKDNLKCVYEVDITVW